MFARRVFLGVMLITAACWNVQAASGRIVKVLPHFLDLEGRRALSPSLYERDAYQAHLRQFPEKRSGMRFDVQWKADSRPLTLKLELRGSKTPVGETLTLERLVKRKGWFSTWSSLTLQGDAYQQAGEVLAWRVSLWDGDQMLAEQKSFLW